MFIRLPQVTSAAAQGPHWTEDPPQPQTMEEGGSHRLALVVFFRLRRVAFQNRSAPGSHLPTRRLQPAQAGGLPERVQAVEGIAQSDPVSPHGPIAVAVKLCYLSQGVGDGQGGLACCDSWGRKESDTTERLI